MSSDGVAGRVGATNAAFPSSCWTAVLSLKPGGDESTEKRVLEKLCETYWYPLYAFARHRGKSSHDAEDAVQSFFCHICDLNYLRKADQGRGKLRTFILTGFTRHLKDLKVHENALKRGGGEELVSIDSDQAEEWLLMDPKSGEDDSAMSFECHWAENLMRVVLDLLREQASGSDQSKRRFEVLSRFLDPKTCGDFTGREAAAELEMSPAACEKAIQRLRHQFRMAVREQVAATLAEPTEEAVMDEMVILQRALVAVG